MNKKSIVKLLSLSMFLSMPLFTCYAVDPSLSSSSVVPQADSSAHSRDESLPIPASSSSSSVVPQTDSPAHSRGESSPIPASSSSRPFQYISFASSSFLHIPSSSSSSALSEYRSFPCENHGIQSLNIEEKDLLKKFFTAHHCGELRNDKLNMTTHGVPLIISAVLENNLQVLKALIHAGADVNAKDIFGMTALMHVSTFGKEEMAIELINTPGIDVNLQGPQDGTALIFAAANNRYQVADLLIYAGADVNAKDQLGMTALMVAAECNSYRVAKLLLTVDVNLDLTDIDRKTALDIANESGHYEIASLIRAKRAENEARGHLAK